MAIKTRYLLFGKHYRGIEIKYSRESDDILKSLNRNKRIDIDILLEIPKSNLQNVSVARYRTHIFVINIRDIR